MGGFVEKVTKSQHNPFPPKLAIDRPERRLGALAAVTIVAGSMLGVGIFLTPRLVAEQVSSTTWFLTIWAMGGLIAFAGSVAYAELGTMFPRAGGDYVYLREAFGPAAGFSSGWLLFVGVFGGSIASMSVAVCQYQVPVLLSAFGCALPDAMLGLSGPQCVAIGLVLLLTMLNVRGVRPAAWAQSLTTLIPIGLLTLFAVYCLVTLRPSFAPPASESLSRPLTLGGLAVAFLHVYFAYAGWNSVAYVGGEIKRPERNLPLGLLGGTAIVGLLYLLLCAAFVRVLGMEQLATTSEAGTATAAKVLGDRAHPYVAAIIALALLGSVNATILAGARIAYAMAGDAILPRALGRLGSAGTPAPALWLQAVLAVLLIVSGSFDLLIQLTSIAMFLLAGLAVVALFLLRRRRPDVPRPYRATGYPFLPGLFLVSSIAVIGLKVRDTLTATEEVTFSERWLPLLGLFVYFGLLIGHRSIGRPAG